MFGYIPGVSPMNSHPKAPVMIAPMINRGGSAKIDMKAFGGQAVVLRADGSIVAFDADSTNEVKDKEGKVIFKDGQAFSPDKQNNGIKVLPPL